MEYYVAPADQGRTLEIDIPDASSQQLFAVHGELVNMMQRAVSPFHFHLSPTDRGVEITGDDIGALVASRIVEHIVEKRADNLSADVPSLRKAVSMALTNSLKRDLIFRLKGLSHPVTPKSLSQVAFMQTLLTPSEQLVLGLGPTGTGKTHLAIAAGLNQLADERVKRVVVTKPHVVMEGEVVTASTRQELDYDEQFEFFDDIFRDLIGYHEFGRLKNERKLELLPLGHLRGRTFNEAYIVIDEAQNMSVRKTRMAVTRIGRGSRMVLTGDPDHVDLRTEEPSGLAHLADMLKDANIGKIHKFEKNHVVRSSLAAQLENLYSGQLDDGHILAA